MDQIGAQEQQKIKKYDQTLKKVSKWLCSMSLFSFFFAFWLLPSHLLFHYNSTLRFHHLFTQPIDKNSMFLLCNGLLVFLANYSGLFKSLSCSSPNSRPNYEYHSFKVFEFEKPLIERLESTELVATQQELMKDESELESGNLESISSRSDDAAAEDEEEDDNYGLGTGFFAEETVEEDDDQEEEEEEEEGNNNHGRGVLSDEELKRKFDEFIKRMKEEITVDDARRTLVVV